MMKLEYEFDVVVVGFGVAGACAAIAAAEHDTRMLVVDRSLGGGASVLSGGVVYAGGDTRYQQAAGYEDTPDNMYNFLRQEVAGAVDDQTLHRFCDESVQRLSWLEYHGASFAASLCDYKTSYPTNRHYLYFSGNERAYPYCLYGRRHAVVRRDRRLLLGLSADARPARSIDRTLSINCAGQRC
jgi:3-oxo-5alpha-steroid 4-dehydrogenase